MTALVAAWATALLWFAPHDLYANQAEANASAALSAASNDVPVEVLLVVAFHESRYVPEASPWPRPYGDRATRPTTCTHASGCVWRCGVMQADARSWRECLDYRDLEHGYAAGADQIQAWTDVCRAHGVTGRTRLLHCALSGYGPGKATPDGTAYSHWVLRQAVRLGALERRAARGGS